MQWHWKGHGWKTVPWSLWWNGPNPAFMQFLRRNGHGRDHLPYVQWHRRGPPRLTCQQVGCRRRLTARLNRDVIQREEQLMAAPTNIQSRGLDYFRRVVALVYREIGVLKASNHAAIAAKINTAGDFFGQQRKVEAKRLYKLSLTDISVDHTLMRYAKRTGLTLDDVYEAFRSGQWGTASGGFAFGGPRWAAITKAAIELGSAIRSKTWAEVEAAINVINGLEHNNGPIVGKFAQLD